MTLNWLNGEADANKRIEWKKKTHCVRYPELTCAGGGGRYRAFYREDRHKEVGGTDKAYRGILQKQQLFTDGWQKLYKSRNVKYFVPQKERWQKGHPPG